MNNLMRGIPISESPITVARNVEFLMNSDKNAFPFSSEPSKIFKLFNHILN